MQLPYGLSAELDPYRSCESGKELLQKLAQTPSHLQIFFQEATDDETWCEHNSQTVTLFLSWFTQQFFEERLTVAFAQPISQSIRRHFHLLSQFLPRNLTVKVDETTFPINSFLFAAESPYFHQLIQTRCFHGQRTKIILRGISPHLFAMIEEYVNTGTIANLWRNEESVLLQLLQIATEWTFEGLMEQCEQTLKRYVSSNNAVDLLLSAQGKPWKLLKEVCDDVIHQNHPDVKIGYRGIRGITFEFLDLSDDAMRLFNQLKGIATHLICSGKLTEEERFQEVLYGVPKLVGLDISGSYHFSDYLREVPALLDELDLSFCGWLNDDNMYKIAAIFPNLKRLAMQSNVQLTYVGWGELIHFDRLIDLDISRCSHVGDEEFHIILKGCPHVAHLRIAECKRITDRGLFELPRALRNLLTLDLSRSSATDSTLVDLGTYCKELMELNLTRCEHVSGKGVISLVKNARELRKLTLTRCPIDLRIQNELMALAPLLEVVL